MHPAFLTSAAAFALVLAPSLTAQQTKVLPPQYTSVEGPFGTAHPFGYTTSKSQQIWLGSAVTSSIALINGFKYRRDYGRGMYPAEPGRTYNNATVSIGTTTVAPDKMSTTYASNVTSPLTKILNKAKLSLPALPASTSQPEAFNIGLNWTTHYIFTGNQGHLILELDLPATLGKSNYIVDAAQVTGGGSGTVTPFGTGGSFSSPEAYKMSADAQSLAPGGAAVITCGNFSKSYTGTLILGLSDTTWMGNSLPFGLGVIGAPNNSLYVSMDFQVPFSTTPFGRGYQSTFSSAIPNGTPYAGVTFYSQAYYLDSFANNAGLVATEALRLTTAKGPTSPLTNMVANYVTTSTTGTFVFGATRFGGPVIQFAGVLP